VHFLEPFGSYSGIGRQEEYFAGEAGGPEKLFSMNDRVRMRIPVTSFWYSSLYIVNYYRLHPREFWNVFLTCPENIY
jgi:hypothetical protein